MPSIPQSARIDMHAHSLRSDGTDQPAEVVRKAREAGLDYIALTDHDTTAGWVEARAAAEEHGIGLIPGIELTTRAVSNDGHGFAVHMLAYLPNPENEPLRLAMGESVEGRLERLKVIVDRLSQDFDLTWNHVLEVLADGKVAGRPAVADAMIARGIFEDRTPFFDLVRPGTKYYVPNLTIPSTRDGIRLIRAAGGVPVIAHPMARGYGPKPGERMPMEHFVGLIEAGLAGFETRHRDVPEHARDWLEDLAAEFGLFTTGSSDYHGHGKPNPLGENLTSPAALEQILSQTGNPQLALLKHV